jgi:hypothetical protein
MFLYWGAVPGRLAQLEPAPHLDRGGDELVRQYVVVTRRGGWS